jgi:hypothetical protein
MLRTCPGHSRGEQHGFLIRDRCLSRVGTVCLLTTMLCDKDPCHMDH